MGRGGGELHAPGQEHYSDTHIPGTPLGQALIRHKNLGVSACVCGGVMTSGL